MKPFEMPIASIKLHVPIQPPVIRLALCSTILAATLAAQVSRAEPSPVSQPARQAEAAGDAIRWERRGAGSGRPLVFLPDLGLPASSWSKVYAQFEKTNPIFLATYAGTDGIPPLRPPSLDRIVDAVIQHIRSDKLDKPILIGHLFGGHVALRVAAEAPDLLSGVFAMPPPAVRLPMEIRLSIATQAAESYLTAEPRLWRPNFAIEVGRAVDDPLIARQIADDLARSDRETYALLTGEAFADSIESQLGKIEVPVCLVAPAELPRPDPTSKEVLPRPAEIAALVTEWYAQSYPGIRRCDVRAIKRTRRYSILESPGLIAFTLGRFLENIEKRDLQWRPTPAAVMPTTMPADAWREVRDRLISRALAATSQAELDADLRSMPEALRLRLLEAERKAAGAQSATTAGDAGMLCLALGRPLRAIPHFQSAAKLDAKSARWQYLLGMACDRAGKTQDAIAAYRRAIALDSRCVPALYRLALALTGDQIDEAYQLLKRAVWVDPADPNVLVALGRVERQLGLSDAALGRFQEALKSSPGWGEAHRECAALLRGKSRDGEANQHAQAWAVSVAATPPNDPFWAEIAGIVPAEALEEAAIAATRARETDAAISILELAVRRTPENVRCRQLYARALDAAGRHGDAAEQFRIVAMSGAPDSSSWDELGGALLLSENPLEAVAVFTAAKQRYPNDHAVSLWLGRFLGLLDRLADANELLESVPATSPLYARARFEIGSILAKSGKEDDAARAEFERAIVADPKLADAYLLLLKLARKSGTADQAVTVLRRGVDACPENALIISDLAWILATDPDPKRRDGVEAVRLGTRACSLTAYSDADCLDNLAAACAETGQFMSAAWLAERAHRIARTSGRKELANEIEDRFKRYSSGIPFRETR